MKKHYLYSLLMIISLASLYDICAKNTLGQAQELHKNIGKTLVQIRRENPVLEKPIYSLLDQVGQMSKLVSVSCEKRKKLKATLFEEKQLKMSMNNDSEKLRSEINSLRQSLRQENSKVLESQKNLESLTREKQDLQKKVSEVIIQKEKEYMAQMKKAEGSQVKAEELLKEMVSQPQPQVSPQAVAQPHQQNVVMHKKESEKKG